MKIVNPLLRFALLWAALAMLASCEQRVQMESIVHEDGSIDRLIELDDADSILAFKNIFGISSAHGWQTTSVALKDPKGEDKKKSRFTFRKSFASAEAANGEMLSGVDTLFKVRSEFEKQFRWFYTYLHYSDTYLSVSRFRKPYQQDFFTSEDYAFIKRMPAEGTPISKADSVYLASLNTRIFDQYAVRAIYEESFDVMMEVLAQHKVEQRWIDKVTAKKAQIFSALQASDKDGLDFMVDVVDSLKVPIARETAAKDYKRLSRDLESRINFMTDASKGKYVHRIVLPWTIVDSNADSVNGAILSWRPPVTKILLGDYTMYAESRKLNYWALIVSVAIVLITVWLFRRNAATRGK